MSNCFQPPGGEEVLSCPLHDCAGVFGPGQSLSDVDTEELDALDSTPINVEHARTSVFCSHHHHQLLCLADVDGEVAVLALHCQVS